MASIRDMIRGQLPKGRQVKQQKRALVCIDTANLIPYLDDLGVKINWKEFKSLFESMYSSVRLIYYAGEITDGFFRSKHPNAKAQEVYDAKKRKRYFFRELEEIGYIVRSKPVAQIYQGAKSPRPKCNFDVEITIDVIDMINDYDVLVLCSGDGDFVPLLKRLKRQCKETHVIAAEGRFNAELRKTANSYDYIATLLHWVQDLKK